MNSQRIAPALLQLSSALTLLTSLALAQAPFSVSGPGATIPAAGSGGGGVWPATLPPSPAVSVATSTVPAAGCQFTALEIAGLSHTYIGDLQFVLRSPTQQRYVIVHRPGFTGTGFGSGGDALGGNYTIVTSGALAIPSTGNWTPGTYNQEFGAGAGMWPTGVAGIFNFPLDTIVCETGTWTLEVYDWASGDTGSFSGWTLHGLEGIPFIASGPGGAIPAVGSGGGGVWPTSLPPLAFESSSSFVPLGPKKISRIVIENLTHTWIGDLQITLSGPSGAHINLVHRPGFNGSNAGNSGDALGGGYHSLVSGGGLPVPTSGDWPPAIYQVSYGSGAGEWPDGSAGIANLPVGALMVSPGHWVLRIYDWAGGDIGACTSWSMNGYVLPFGPISYCTSSVTSNGCSPGIATIGNNSPSATYANPCDIYAYSVEGQKNGLFFYGVDGQIAVPFGSGFMCVAPPRQRTGLQFSGGNAGACNGGFALDWNAYRIANPFTLGWPWNVGSSLFVQAWFRDPASPSGTALTNGLLLTHHM